MIHGDKVSDAGPSRPSILLLEPLFTGAPRIPRYARGGTGLLPPLRLENPARFPTDLPTAVDQPVGHGDPLRAFITPGAEPSRTDRDVREHEGVGDVIDHISPAGIEEVPSSTSELAALDFGAEADLAPAAEEQSLAIEDDLAVEAAAEEPDYTAPVIESEYGTGERNAYEARPDGEEALRAAEPDLAIVAPHDPEVTGAVPGDSAEVAELAYGAVDGDENIGVSAAETSDSDSTSPAQSASGSAVGEPVTDTELVTGEYLSESVWLGVDEQGHGSGLDEPGENAPVADPHLAALVFASKHDSVLMEGAAGLDQQDRDSRVTHDEEAADASEGEYRGAAEHEYDAIEAGSDRTKPALAVDPDYSTEHGALETEADLAASAAEVSSIGEAVIQPELGAEALADHGAPSLSGPTSSAADVEPYAESSVATADVSGDEREGEGWRDESPGVALGQAEPEDELALLDTPSTLSAAVDHGFPKSLASAARAWPDSARLDRMAERLEEIARALRQRDAAGSLVAQARDPLGALITGYLLGYFEGRESRDEDVTG